MSRIKPIVVCLSITVLILWILLGAITFPNASRWLGGTDHVIKKDWVYFDLDNTSQIDNAHKIDYGQRYFKLNIAQIENTPSASSEGIKGILYDMGESCKVYDAKKILETPFLTSHQSIPKIALIRHNEPCILADILLNAEVHGAVGAIVYQLDSNRSTHPTSFNTLGVMPNTIKIPAYTVGYDTGFLLSKDLQYVMDKQNESGIHRSEVMALIELLPSQKALLNRWQFALIVVGMMALVSVVAIMLLQLYLWRVAKREEEMNVFDNFHDPDLILTREEQQQLANHRGFWREAAGSVPAQQKLDQAIVNLLPTREFSSPEEIVDEKKIEDELVHCVICLESFREGEILRRLPCNHEYHKDCIDVWLTKKSNACPLCLHRIEIPTVPEESHLEEGRAHSNLSETDVGIIWRNMLRDRRVALRIHPRAYTRT